VSKERSKPDSPSEALTYLREAIAEMRDTYPMPPGGWGDSTIIALAILGLNERLKALEAK
jgi:hypothetical protein